MPEPPAVLRRELGVTDAVVAFCNAASSAQLAAVHLQVGGTYLYGRRVNYYGVTRTAAATRVRVGVTLAVLGLVLVGSFGGGAGDPARTIPLAVPLALGVVVVVYASVGVAVLLVLGADGTAASTAPLRDAVQAGLLHALAPL